MVTGHLLKVQDTLITSTVGYMKKKTMKLSVSGLEIGAFPMAVEVSAVNCLKGWRLEPVASDGNTCISIDIGIDRY